MAFYVKITAVYSSKNLANTVSEGFKKHKTKLG